MADIAAVFHWPKSEIEALDIDELRIWRELAVQRWNMMHGKKEGA